MAWRDDILEAVPPSHEGEPHNLRQDILDELSDHLECAMHRELKQTDDVNRARSAVLERFGNPSGVARRLWLDAMKGQLMNQRVMFFTQLGTIAAMMVLCGVVIMNARQQHQMQAALIAKIEAGSAPQHSSFDWPGLRLQVLQPDGSTGIAGLGASLDGEPYTPGNRQTLGEQTDNEGNASFGPMRPGIYTLRVFREDGVGFSRQVVVPPGPEQPPLVAQWIDPPNKPTPVDLRVELPAQLQELDWVIKAELRQRPIAPKSKAGEWVLPSMHIALAKDGQVAILDNNTGAPFRELSITEEDVVKLPWQNQLTLDAGIMHYFGNAEFAIKHRDSAEPDRYVKVASYFGFEESAFRLGRLADGVITLRPDDSFAHATSQFMKMLSITARQATSQKTEQGSPSPATQPDP